MRTASVFSTSLLIAAVAGLLTVADAAARQMVSPGSGTPFPQVICDAEPRTVAELSAIETGATPIPDDYDTRLYRGDLPTGVQADRETVAGITRTLQQWVACNLVGDGDGLRLAALLTDNLLRIQAATSDSPLLSFATPVPNPNQDGYLAAVEDVQLLPDGSVSAIVTWGGLEDGHPAPGRTVLIIFLQEGDRWLIDGLYERVWLEEPNTFPVYIADAVATPVPES